MALSPLSRIIPAVAAVSFTRAPRRVFSHGFVTVDGTKMGKSIVASRDLPKGHVLTERDLALKSPGGGIPPYEWDRLVATGGEQVLGCVHVRAGRKIAPRSP